MKKLFFVLALVLSTVEAFAGSGQNASGSDSCGLGWQVTDKKTFIATTTRGTTNYVVPYTFGMTTGTLGCDQHSFAKKDAESVKFVAGNYEPLIIDMSQGKGEYLSALADTMGCTNKEQFGQEVKKNYGQIVNSSKNAVDFYMNVKSAASCQVI